MKISGRRSHQRIRGAGPEYTFAVVCAGEVDLAKCHGFSCAYDACGDQGVLSRQGFHEGAGQLNRAARPELTEVLDQCEHHGCVGSGHHGLPAQHAAHARQLIAVRQAQGDTVRLCAFYFQAEGLNPGGEQIGQGLLQVFMGGAHSNSLNTEKGNIIRLKPVVGGPLTVSILDTSKASPVLAALFPLTHATWFEMS